MEVVVESEGERRGSNRMKSWDTLVPDRVKGASEGTKNDWSGGLEGQKSLWIKVWQIKH